MLNICTEIGSTKESNNLSIKGHGVFVRIIRNEVLPFEFRFTLDIIHKEIHIVNRINRFCLQWTPNQMKQMSEGKQVFLIEEQSNLLRGWIDKTRTVQLTYLTSKSPYSIQMDCSVVFKSFPDSHKM